MLTEDEIEAKELVEKQASRRDRRVAEKVASQVIDLVETNINAPIVIDDNEIGDIVRNSFNEVIADFLPVTTSTQSEAEEEPNILLAQVEVNKRIRLSNTMIGEIRKGKYSK